MPSLYGTTVEFACRTKIWTIRSQKCQNKSDTP